jgi:carbonic anhydrase
LDDPNKTKGILKNIAADNGSFVKRHDEKYFEKMFDGQTPRAVVLGCSDSRFHMHAVDRTPDNDLFVIRNIGNLYKNSRGSVMYAVNHLGVPTVIVIGHDSCGAVTAATSGIAELEAPIKKELKTLKLPVHNKKPSDDDIKQNVLFNVHQQVDLVKKDFKEKVESKKLNVFGAVYDFKNVYGKGYGALVFVNWNGEKDIKKIESAAKDLGVDNLKIG